jgi:raffinose/stachyose/melibiose transport system substrate-binding protein
MRVVKDEVDLTFRLLEGVSKLKEIRKRVILSIFATFLLFVVLAACSSNKNESGSNKGDDGGNENEEVTLTFLVDNQTVLDGIEAVSAEIEKKYNIKTEYEVRPGGTEGDNIVKTRLVTGEMADLMWYNSGSLFKALNPEQYFADLSNEEFIDRVDEAFLDAVSADDQVFGIPGQPASAGGWLYNKKVYEELGLSVPNTWEELMDNNQIIKDAGKIPVVASYKDTWTSQLLILADYYNVHTELPSFAEEYTNNQVKFSDTPLAARGFEKLQEIHEAGYTNSEENATSYEDGLRLIAEGEAAHYPMLTFSLSALNDTYPDAMEDIGFFGQPGDNADNHGLTVWMPGGIYANKDSEHVEAAKQWMEFFISDEGMEIYMANMNAEGPYMIKGIELPDDAFPAVQEMVAYLDGGKTAPALEFLSPLKGPSLEQITIEVGLGFIPGDEGAAKYDKDVEKQAKQLGLEGW